MMSGVEGCNGRPGRLFVVARLVALWYLEKAREESGSIGKSVSLGAFEPTF